MHDQFDQSSTKLAWSYSSSKIFKTFYLPLQLPPKLSEGPSARTFEKVFDETFDRCVGTNPQLSGPDPAPKPPASQSRAGTTPNPKQAPMHTGNFQNPKPRRNPHWKLPEPAPDRAVTGTFQPESCGARALTSRNKTGTRTNHLERGWAPNSHRTPPLVNPNRTGSCTDPYLSWCP